MGFDPISIGLMVGLAGAGVAGPTAGVIAGIAGAGGAVLAAQGGKKSKSKAPIGAAPTSIDAGADATGKKRKAYRPAAQMFKDEDLRLGSAGKLGM